jgi:hypothetical protein
MLTGASSPNTIKSDLGFLDKILCKLACQKTTSQIEVKQSMSNKATIGMHLLKFVLRFVLIKFVNACGALKPSNPGKSDAILCLTTSTALKRGSVLTQSAIAGGKTSRVPNDPMIWNGPSYCDQPSIELFELNDDP